MAFSIIFITISISAMYKYVKLVMIGRLKMHVLEVYCDQNQAMESPWFMMANTLCYGAMCMNLAGVLKDISIGLIVD